jgi:hypothetical protein
MQRVICQCAPGRRPMVAGPGVHRHRVCVPHEQNVGLDSAL